ncbi:FAD-binding protein [Candidatus Micrarchaeota archaeon]|nr:FAD-binding protein [Candidatus Micrarchaeota archaeon]
MLKHDILIIGGGLAGLRAAIEIKGKADVAIICKTYPNQAHSSEAQGGINAAINPSDNWVDHAYDTALGGDFLNDQDAVEKLCSDAPRVIKEMEEFGVCFSKDEKGNIAQRPFGAQRFIRTAYAADRTGHALLHTVYKKAIELGVQIYNEHFVTSLIVEGDRVAGATVMNLANGEIIPIAAKAVIMASGGAGRVYGKTTNPANTGDGIAMAYRAGAGIMDMEIVQFHPTTLKGSNKLLSEAARGEGAYLINSSGERFMKKYAPHKMELASRDVVTRAEATEIKEGRGVLGDSVYLDFRHLDPEVIATRLPDIKRNALELVGIDITKSPVPVQPGQHYTMGGIMTDIECRTELSGLFAAGECACVSVHGANRLGGNSLMETLVFGRQAGESALNHIKGKNFGAVGDKEIREIENKAKTWMGEKDERTPRTIRNELGHVMDEMVGPFRNKEMLKEARDRVQKLRKEKIGVSEHGKIFNAELVNAFELDFMLDLASCTIESALERKESRGAHTRTDYPKRDDTNWLKHIVCNKSESGPTLKYRAVKITRFEPVAREY